MLFFLQGIVATLKDGFGFIQCTDREGRMFFHYSENMDFKGEPPMNQEVEFTVIPVSGLFAIIIIILS